VRIDLGGETRILKKDELREMLATLGTTKYDIFVDPDADPDWQSHMLDPRSPAFVIALRTEIDGAQVDLLWIKPRLLADLPTDIVGYAADNKTFPQQTTGDQFFDEAQWESYRRLGQECMNRLLEACPRLLVSTFV